MVKKEKEICAHFVLPFEVPQKIISSLMAHHHTFIPPISPHHRDILSTHTVRKRRVSAV